MKAFVATAVTCLILIGGCPGFDSTGSTSAVDAVIAYASSSGEAPFTIILSAAESSSTNGGSLVYLWDFDDGTTSTDVQVTHTYENPGKYSIKLRVTDETGDFDRVGLEVRVQGEGAIAVIAVDKDSGTSPLTVQFDATESIVEDDTIGDYYWDFGDGTTSTKPKPSHVFKGEGDYEVELKITTAGGIEAHTFTTITVSAGSGASLAFDGGSFATLPLVGASDLELCTFEAWVYSQSEGGTIASVGTALSVELYPTASTLRIRVNGVPSDFTSASLSGHWRHIAVACEVNVNDPNDTGGVGNEAGLATVYLDGAPLGSTAIYGTVSASAITVGNGFRGNIGVVRFWDVARSQGEINGAKGSSSVDSVHLLGAWAFDEGKGQTLGNDVTGVPNGTLGAAATTESTDPDWSSNAPPT